MDYELQNAWYCAPIIVDIKLQGSVEELSCNNFFLLSLKWPLIVVYVALWGGRWKDGAFVTTGEEVEQINSHFSRLGTITKHMLPYEYLALQSFTLWLEVSLVHGISSGFYLFPLLVRHSYYCFRFHQVWNWHFSEHYHEDYHFTNGHICTTTKLLAI